MNVKDLFDLSGKVALVTGGSRGLGKEIAQGFGEAGAKVAVTARRESWLEPTAKEFEELGLECLALKCDAASPDQIRETVDAVLKRFGKIDILVNNAGITWAASPLHMTLEKWNEVMTVNVTGPFLTTQAVLPGMIERRSGSIINIASVAGLVGSKSEEMDAIGYSTSKGALISFTRDLAVKAAPFNIRVNAVAPGFFPTRMTEHILGKKQEMMEAGIPLGRVGREGELKGAALFLASEASSYVTGQVLVVDGGATVR